MIHHDHINEVRGAMRPPNVQEKSKRTKSKDKPTIAAFGGYKFFFVIEEVPLLRGPLLSTMAVVEEEEDVTSSTVEEAEPMPLELVPSPAVRTTRDENNTNKEDVNFIFSRNEFVASWVRISYGFMQKRERGKKHCLI